MFVECKRWTDCISIHFIYLPVDVDDKADDEEQSHDADTDGNKHSVANYTAHYQHSMSHQPLAQTTRTKKTTNR